MPSIIPKQKSIEEHAAAMAKLLETGGKMRKNILLQLPEGLRWKANEIIDALKAHVDVVLSGNRCFGACDIPLREAAAVNADAIVHVGHRPFYRKTECRVPVLYYDWPVDFTINEKEFAEEIKKINEKKIGIVSSVQYIGIAEKIAETANKLGKDAAFGGYILGCWQEPARELLADGYEAILFVGSGMFHPLGTECRYVFDIERGGIRDVSEEQKKWQKRRIARIAKAMDAKVFGILVSTKSGQKELQAEAEEIKKRLEQKDKKAFIIVMDEITSDVLSDMKADAFINTACPRIADDEWKKPVINADELDTLLGRIV